MTSTLSAATCCQVVGRLLQQQPSDAGLQAFCELFPQVGMLDEDAVQQDYLRLFVGLGTPLAPPWESAWANDARLLFQRETLDVRYWYRSAGLQVGALHREPDDHIGYQLEFVGLLLQRGDAETAAAFAQEHPLRWVRRWQQAVEAEAETAFYPQLAQQAVDVLESLAG